MIRFENTKLFACRKGHAGFIKLSLASSLRPLPGVLEAHGARCLDAVRGCLPGRPAAEATDRREGRHPHRLSLFARYSEMLMFRSSAEQNEMLTTWNFPQNKRFLFRPALTYTHTHICRIINCYVMTPDCMPASTVWYGGNPALKNPVLEQPPESHGAWQSPFSRSNPELCAVSGHEASAAEEGKRSHV